MIQPGTMALALWLAAGTAQTLLVDEPFTVPSNEWRYVDVGLNQVPVSVHCIYTTRPDAPGVRVALLDEQDLETLRNGTAPALLTQRPFAPQGGFEEQVSVPGRYAVVIENRQDPRGATRVYLRVMVGFLNQQAGYVSPRRKLAVILISFGVFFAVVSYSARKLLRAVR